MVQQLQIKLIAVLRRCIELQLFNKKGVEFVDKSSAWGGKRKSLIPTEITDDIIEFVRHSKTNIVKELLPLINLEFNLNITYSILYYFLQKNGVKKQLSVPPIKRDEFDFYKTPPKATNALLRVEKFPGTRGIWDCCCGDGAIAKEILRFGYKKVYASDLIYRGYGEGGIDFLKYTGKSYDCIVSNPPYKYAKIFIQIAQMHCDKIAFLLRTSFLESKSRRFLFLNQEFPLIKVYQFSERISIYSGTANKNKKKNAGKTAYAWFIFEKKEKIKDKSYAGKPLIEWV